MAEAHVDLDAAVDAAGPEPDRGGHPVALLVHLLDVDAEGLPRLVHLAPELRSASMAAVNGRQVGEDARGADLDLGVQQTKPGVAVVAIPGLVSCEQQF